MTIIKSNNQPTEHVKSAKKQLHFNVRQLINNFQNFNYALTAMYTANLLSVILNHQYEQT